MLTTTEKRCLKTYKKHIGITHPEIAKTLHPHKNIYKIENLTHGSDSRSVWWLCSICNTDWQCTPFRRIHKNQNCPTCRKKQALSNTSLGHCYPHLIEEWHPTQNGTLDPFSIANGSRQKIWWKCKECSHEWVARAYSRTSGGSGCPICQRKKHAEYLKKINRVEREINLLVTHPYLETAWDAEKNYPLTMKHISPRSNRRTWWRCPHCNYSFSRNTFSFVKKRSRQICNACQKPIYFEQSFYQ